MNDQTEVRYLGDVQRLALDPSDVLILRFKEKFPDHVVEQIRERFKSALGPEFKNKVLVITGDAEICAIASNAEASG